MTGKAIAEFNLARRDDFWGAAALTHMVELYVNPDQEGVWEERDNGPIDDATRSNIAAAEQLLSELRPIAKYALLFIFVIACVVVVFASLLIWLADCSRDELRVRVLDAYCALATRNKLNVDRAMQSFVEMLDNDQDYLPAVLGMATGFMIEKNQVGRFAVVLADHLSDTLSKQHKARNLLKRVAKMEMNKHDGEDFEKANLLLAKFYIDKVKCCCNLYRSVGSGDVVSCGVSEQERPRTRNVSKDLGAK
jgi:tetratricopeptide repeat protein 21B